MPSTTLVAKPLNNLKSEFLRLAKVCKVKLLIGFVAPLYVEVPEICDGRPVFHMNFVESMTFVLKVYVLSASKFREM